MWPVKRGIKMVKYKLKNGSILKDGHTMFLEDVVRDLERKAYLEEVKTSMENVMFAIGDIAGVEAGDVDGLLAWAEKTQNSD